MRIFIISLIVYLLSISTAIAQEVATIENPEKKVVVYLKDKSSVQGEIVDWVLDEYITIKTAWSDNFIITSDKIEKIVQTATLNSGGRSVYNFAEEGIYYSIKGQLITGNGGNRAHGRMGYGVSASAGKRLNRWVGLGLGVGYDQYIWASGENLIPVFAEFSSFFQPKNTSLYFNCAAGYSFTASPAERYLVQDSKGGAMLYPSLGIRLGQGDSKFTLDFGYKFQKARFTYGDQWSTDTSAQRLTYKRFCIRLGLLI